MKNYLRLTLSCLILLSGCASVIEGSSQQVTVITTPEGASCSMARAGVALSTIPATPGSVYIDKTKDDLTITCTKPGFQDVIYLNESKYPEDNWAWILIGGPVGWGVDSLTGADNQYTSPVSIDLVPIK